MLKALLVLALLSPGDLFLGPKAPPGFATKRPGDIADWIERLRSADAAIKESNWKVGARISDSVLREMVQSITGGEGTSNLLATGLLYRALGNAGMGKKADAAWDFAVARYFFPDYARADLSPFGSAGEVLDELRRAAGVTMISVPQASGPQQVVPPRRVKAPPPDYPRGKRIVCIEGTVAVRVLLNEQGVPESPAVVSTIDPVFSLAALEAIRKWRFEPATIDGQPLAVHYTLTVNFKSPRCDV